MFINIRLAVSNLTELTGLAHGARSRGDKKRESQGIRLGRWNRDFLRTSQSILTYWLIIMINKPIILLQSDYSDWTHTALWL